MPVVAADVRRRTHWAVADFRLPTNGGQSGRGQPHSKTLSRRVARRSFREVLECGYPLPLLFLRSARAVPFLAIMPLDLGVAGLLTSGATGSLHRDERLRSSSCWS